MSKNKTINVKGTEISIFQHENSDYISLTDIARFKDLERTEIIIQNWIRNRNSIELLGFWEQLYNPGFKHIEFDVFRKNAGLNSFTLNPKQWIERTNAIGIISKPGRYGGTFAHKDIAFEFASWISIEFKLYIIKEFQRLKADENDRLKLEWNLQRTLSKINYRIHTDAIKENIIPALLSKKDSAKIYANEADILNMALFGKTAQQWRNDSSKGSVGKAAGNIRDHANLEQLVVLSNLESINAVLIHQGLPQGERLLQLNKIAISQMKSLVNSSQLKNLK